MAVYNITVTPKIGPGGRPLLYTLEGGMRIAVCTLTLPTGVAYAAADRCRLNWALESSGSQDFQAHFGARIIKQVIFSTNFSDLNAPTGEMKGEWIAATQLLQLRMIGVNAASNAGVDDAELTDGTQMAGTCSAEAMCFF